MAKGIIAGGSGSSNINPNPTPTPEQNSALGVPRKIITNLLVSAWDAENSQVVDVLSLSADKNAQLVHILPENEEVYTDSGIVASVVEAGKMKFVAETVPEVDLEVMIVLEELGTQNPEAPDELVLVMKDIPVVSDGSVPVDSGVWIDTQEEADEEASGGGVDIPAQDTEPEESLFWLDTSEQGGTYLNKGETEALIDEKIAGIEMPSGGVEMVLLWENASPTSQFNAQTISVDLSQYDMFLVEHYSPSVYSSNSSDTYGASSAVWGRDVFTKNSSGSGSLIAATYGQGRIYGHYGVCIRRFTYTESSISFNPAFFGGNAYQNSDYASNNVYPTKANTNGCNPVKIYGIKGVTFNV